MSSTEHSVARYSHVAMILHWCIAVLILFNLGLGFFMEGFAPPLRGQIVGLHVSSGFTVLALTVVRILWRLTHRPPPFPAAMAGWERGAAHAAHALIYVLMLAMPITGWSIISAHPPRPGGGPMVWGLLHVPPIGPIAAMEAAAQHAAHENFVRLHSLGGWCFLVLLALHVLGALKHQWIDRYPELARMGLGRMRSGS